MPLRISSQEESINWYFSLHGQIFQEEEVKGIVWGIKGEFFINFSFIFSSFSFAFSELYICLGLFFFLPLFLAGTQCFISLEMFRRLPVCLGMFSFIFFSLCIRKYTICKKPTVSLTQGSRRGGGGCLGRSGKCLRQLEQAPNSPRNVLKQVCVINRSEREEQGKGISPSGTAKGLKTILPPLPPGPKCKFGDLGRDWSGMQRDFKTASHREFLLGGTRHNPILKKPLGCKRIPIKLPSCIRHILCE